MVTRYREIADDLRQRLDAGEYPPGARLPGFDDLTQQYDVGRGVIREALSVLELEGRIRVVKKAGIIALDPTAETDRIDRGRQVQRNDLGYVFNAAAGHWAPVATPTRYWMPAGVLVARLLDVEPGASVLARHRVVGPGRPMQIAISYLPEWLARGTVLEEAHTGPGGIYDRIEQDMGHGPLSWHEDVSARMPAPEEARTLEISRATPLLVITRVSTSRGGRPVEVNVTCMSAARFHVGYPVERSESARWPVQVPATGENRPESRKEAT